LVRTITVEVGRSDTSIKAVGRSDPVFEEAAAADEEGAGADADADAEAEAEPEAEAEAGARVEADALLLVSAIRDDRASGGQ
jgi:hypothetical protein